MIKAVKTHYSKLGALMITGMVIGSPTAAFAGNNFGNISENITKSIADVPGLLSAVSYLFGVLIGTLGILKIKDHVENPTQTPLKDGAIRLAVGGGLFALPIIFEAMSETIGTDNAGIESAKLKKVSFGVQ